MLSFSEIAEVFSEIEEKSGRIEMTEILGRLFKKADAAEAEKLAYIIQGIVAPPYEGIDLGIGEKFAEEAIAGATGYSKKEIEKRYRKSGDLGATAEELISKKKQTSLESSERDVLHVFSTLKRIATKSGRGSQDAKIKMLTELLNNSSPAGARYIIRFAIGKLRLGVGDPTVLDALSHSKKGDKSDREMLERAYNICSDMGYVVRLYLESPRKVKKLEVTPFKPLMPALAERLSSPKEIIEKLGKCAVEHKYDGFRLQCHKKDGKVEIYSRKLEKMTHMFPDIVESVKSLKPDEIIFEGEALAYNKKEQKYYSFQRTMHRRRKHGIKKASEELPLNVFCFDLLYVNGKDFTKKPYSERRKKLEKIFPKGILRLSEEFIVKKPEKLKKIFKESLVSGLEGIMAKDLDAGYTAGKRQFAWIKLKKSYGASVDTVDGVIIGYYHGKGSRAEFKFGGLLIAVRNVDSGKLETVAKIGSGFTEKEMVELQKMLSGMRTEKPPKNLDYGIEPDYWVEPEKVVEVAFDEITRSPTHTCGREGGKGLALRFPRMVELREDKGPKDSTTTDEVERMYEVQKHGEYKGKNK